MRFDEPSRTESQLRGGGWRHLATPVPVRCYIAGTWMEQAVHEVDDDTHAVRVTFDTLDHGITHVILEPGSYSAPADTPLAQWTHQGRRS